MPIAHLMSSIVWDNFLASMSSKRLTILAHGNKREHHTILGIYPYKGTYCSHLSEYDN